MPTSQRAASLPVDKISRTSARHPSRGDPVVAGAIFDGLMHRVIVFNIKGPSWRMRDHQQISFRASDALITRSRSQPSGPQRMIFDLAYDRADSKGRS